MSISMKLIIGAVLITAIFMSSPLQAGDKDVNVVNDENSPVPVTIQNDAKTIVEWRYVGYTEWEDSGRFEYGGLIGIAAMNKACAEDFGPGARAATISEALFIDSPVDPATDEDYHWLVPGGSMTAELGANGYVAHDAATGVRVSSAESYPATALTSAYCDLYTQSIFEKRAPIFNALVGAVELGVCTLNLPAACSAPVVTPVTPLP